MNCKGKIFLFISYLGEDSYSIESGSTMVEEAVKPFVESDFDKETFYGEDSDLTDILNFASAFPFGSGKKLVIIKGFEKIYGPSGPNRNNPSLPPAFGQVWWHSDPAHA